MPIGTQTPRDKFDQLLAFVRRTMRYWWLVGVITFIGGALAVVFALTQKPKFLSETKIFYNERIQSSVLQGRDYGVNTKNLGYHYEEMLMSRTNIQSIIEKLELFPKVRDKKGIDAALEEFDKSAKFRVRGTGMFNISFLGEDPEKSQAVTAMMVDILMREDERLRREQASATLNFLLEEKAKINKDLDQRNRELAKFLTEHPEFALDNTVGGAQTPGATIRAQAKAKSGQGPAVSGPTNVDPRILALERQRRRIRDRLAAPDQVGPPRKTPEQIEAERLVSEAERDLRSAQRALQDRLSRLQPAHPDVIQAQSEVAAAQRRVRQLEAAVPSAAIPNKPIDRSALEGELREVERQIAGVRSSIREESGDDETAGEAEVPLSEEDWVIKLETEYARLKQAVEEQQKRLESTDSSLSRAQITASQQMAEQGAVLSIIDPPSLPTLPQGKGRAILAAAGTAVFIILGTLLALALALIDDRIYSAGDLERLAIAPVAVVVPKMRKPGLLRRLFRRG
ncbi:GumC family protein [Haliangium ochraceum]|uniref:Lipopolysaccharide biosynthesis protein n=1 Tax=Haliangium ochraceum (strain DSM 14365 / JCM 11303 / SMP-2) TaxID=502025 RepID=D0LHI4_HALO1|nr:lipopolysaccharide biosynthesis protein [Haliangium ochraceum]ACY12846.1 lipopolysaccharide biosynthesis protein [Haliangium ochraceum DSM 14365]